jgi:hypothetical protein
MPEFTAEASLYKTSGHYRMLSADGDSTVRVLPAVKYCQYICNLCRITG